MPLDVRGPWAEVGVVGSVDWAGVAEKVEEVRRWGRVALESGRKEGLGVEVERWYGSEDKRSIVQRGVLYNHSICFCR